MRLRWLMITLSLLLLLGAAVACGGGGDDDDDGDDDTSATPEETGGQPTQEGEPVNVSDLARGVVEIFALDSSDEPVWHGSGTIITKDGLILTNAHVVDTRFDEYERLGVGLTEDEDQAPELTYAAEIRAVDYALDLAVIEITEELDGDDVLQDFPFVSLGDSDDVGIGDELRILGYPGIGGDTITFTRGSVSGFTSDRSVGDRAWIKTDATIAGGNSGGLAVNSDGELIGVPSVVGSGSDSGFADCRVLQDTNGDNVVDELDSCIPVGGFINGIRPLKLALDLIDAVQNNDEYVSPYYDIEDVEETPSGGFDTEDVTLTNLVFSDGVDTDTNEPLEIVKLMPSGVGEVCGFWDYEGMSDGMNWDAIWFVDGEQNDGGSIIGDTWVGGESGNWWVCIFDEEVGLVDGLYELTIQVEGETAGSDAIFVGGDRELVNFDLKNESSSDICAAWVSPSGAQNWGFEDLGADVFLDAGTTVTLEIATGTYDILMRDCESNDILEDYEIDVTEDSTYTVSDN